jgi:hypothetical protein
MAVVLQQVMPEGVGMEMLDEVTAEMGVENDPPAGLVVHVHFVQDGRAHIVDVWDSVQDFEAFNKARLEPAVARVMERNGMTMEGAPEPETSILDVHAIVRG